MIGRGGCGGGVRRGEGCWWLGFCEGPSVGEEAPEPGRIEVKAELEAEDGCEMLLSAPRCCKTAGGGGRSLTREEEVDAVEHVVDDAARLRLKLGLGRVGDKVGKYEEGDESLELSRLIQYLSSVSQASDQT